MPAPSLVDPRGPRLAAALTTVVLTVALLTGNLWVLLAQTAVFALGALDRSPYAVVFRRVLRPRLGPPSELEDPRPLRFAQAVGLSFAVVGLTGVAVGLPALTLVAVAAALAAAFLNAAFGVCLGCEVYLLLRRSPIARYTPTAPVPSHRPEVPA